MRRFDPDGQWDDHIRLVFSVFVGVSIAQAFDFATSITGSPAQLLLFALTCYVVLDNWYHLNMDLRIVDISSAYQLSLCLVALITYSCFPFLYGVKSQLLPDFGPAEWMLANLALVCASDAMLKGVIWLKLHTRRATLDQPAKELYGQYVFFVLSGLVYAFGLSTLLLLHVGSDMLARGMAPPAAIVTAIWAGIRILDYVVVRPIADWLYRTFAGPPPENPSPAV